MSVVEALESDFDLDVRLTPREDATATAGLQSEQASGVTRWTNYTCGTCLSCSLCR
jgi:hypothetical protein